MIIRISIVRDIHSIFAKIYVSYLTHLGQCCPYCYFFWSLYVLYNLTELASVIDALTTVKKFEHKMAKNNISNNNNAACMEQSFGLKWCEFGTPTIEIRNKGIFKILLICSYLQRCILYSNQISIQRQTNNILQKKNVCRGSVNTKNEHPTLFLNCGL